MKKLLGIIILGLLWCNVGFAGQDCRQVPYITEDGFKRYKEVCGATLFCDSSYRKYDIIYIFDFKNKTMSATEGVLSGRNEQSWSVNIVGSPDLEFGVFAYYIGKQSNEYGFSKYIFTTIWTNLDNKFLISRATGDSFEFKEIKRFGLFL